MDYWIIFMVSCRTVWTEMTRPIRHVVHYIHHYPIHHHVRVSVYHAVSHPFMVASIVCVASPLIFGVPPVVRPIGGGIPIALIPNGRGFGGGGFGGGFGGFGGEGGGGDNQPQSSFLYVPPSNLDTSPPQQIFVDTQPPPHGDTPPSSPPTSPPIVPVPEPTDWTIFVLGMAVLTRISRKHRNNA